MKKRTVIAMMMALVLACLTGCGSKQLTAEEALAKAMEKQQAMTSMDIDMKMDVSMEIMGQTVDYDANMNIKAVNLNKEDMQMAMQTNINMLGQELAMNAYYTDGCYYMDAMGEKGKMEMDIAEVTDTLKQNSAFSEIPADAYQSLEMTEEGGNRVLTYVADGSQLTELADSLMGGMMGVLGESESIDVNLGDVSGTLTVDKDFNIVAQTMKMDMDMTIEGMDVSASADIDITENNPGQEVTIELPDDLDSYEESIEE